MKRVFASVVSALLLIFLLAGTALAAPAAEKERVVFKGSLQAIEFSDFHPGPPPIVLATASGSGHGTRLGKFTYNYTVTIYLNPDGSGVGTTYYHWVAANGDTLDSVGDGFGAPVAGMPGVNHVVEKHIVTGGTGRFAGATGKFTVDRLADRAANTTSGTFNGYLILTKDD